MSSTGSHRQQQQPQRPPLALAAADAEIRKIFSHFDTDGDGRISPSELAAVSRVISPLPTESAGGREVGAMMDELDADRDGFVDFPEFAAFHGRGRGESELDAELRAAFDVYDINGDGRITVAELSKVLARIGQGSSDEECVRIISSVDIDGDGCIGFDEFKKMMCRDDDADKHKKE